MLINFVDATNDANHYTKPPPPRTDKCGDGRLAVVHRFERLEPSAHVTFSILELANISDASASGRREDLTHAVCEQHAVWKSTGEVAQEVPELAVATGHNVHVLALCNKHIMNR